MTADVQPPRRALIVRGGWDGHQPREATELFIPFLEANGFRVEVHEDTRVYADARTMSGFDLIVQCNTMTVIQGDEIAGLRAAVEAGTGMGGWHGGIADSYRNEADYLQLIGGQFAHHAGKHPDERIGEQSDNYLPYTVTMTELGREHEITRGVDDFDLVTEQYWVLHDDLIDILATTTTPARAWDPWKRPVTSPVFWTRQWGEGRIFVSTVGHRVEVLEDPTVRTVVERGLLWAARTA
ncbi:ThuA domain-containing protein [Herbiconiux sp. L3-i23]|uniref:ThuA domain-containing protein n=1 Tax=Herbiconiux sp. L3-i23 TaxID=2905871 RepID=UPI002073BE8C|nr:ThuA domain-containing protein [Herbiconiux sp. L3-i23]